MVRLITTSAKCILQVAFIGCFLVMPLLGITGFNVGTVARTYFAQGIGAFICGIIVLCAAVTVQAFLAQRGPAHVAWRIAAVIAACVFLLWPSCALLFQMDAGAWYTHPPFKLFVVAALVRFAFDIVADKELAKEGMLDPLLSLFIYFVLLLICCSALGFAVMLFLPSPVPGYSVIPLVLLRVVQAIMVFWGLAAASFFVLMVVAPHVGRTMGEGWETICGQAVQHLMKGTSVVRARSFAFLALMAVAVPLATVTGLPYIPQAMAVLASVILRGIVAHQPLNANHPLIVVLEAATEIGRSPFRITRMVVGGKEEAVPTLAPAAPQAEGNAEKGASSGQ